MIRLEGLTKIYRTDGRDVRSLAEVSLEIQAGEFLVVRGPSGCGKTTLLLSLGGMLRPTAGRVWVEGRDLYGLSAAQRTRYRAETVGFVFQMFHLVPYLNVLENVLLAGGGRPASRERALAWLDRLGLTTRLAHRVDQLSTGERQRAALARALLHQPRLLLADEPTGNLDPSNGAEVHRHLAEFHRQGGTVVLVTHGPPPAGSATRVVELEAGRLRTGSG